MARALARVEVRPDDPATCLLLDQAYADPRAQVIGLTGPPGVGKSTLIDGLMHHWRARGRSIGVIAVDPSSRRSGGALLGDRMRLTIDPTDSQVFVRSMAARDRLGGLASHTVAAMVLMRAVYDLVLLETVGVGQSETDIAQVADTVLFCVQPASGDSLQYMKAGIAEIPDIVAVTKSDLGQAATRAAADVKGALSLAEAGARPVPVLLVSIPKHSGIEELAAAIEDHWGWLGHGDRLFRCRNNKTKAWLDAAIRERFGRVGLQRAGLIEPQSADAPFSRLAELSRCL